jgi:hypothetical protein
MTAEDVTTPAENEDRSTEPLEPPSQEFAETTRIAALLRERFGIER